MMKLKNDTVRKIIIIVGVGLLVAAMVLLIVWQWNIRTAEQNSKEYVRVIRELIPDPQGAVPEERRDNTMATLSVDGTDFVGLLEFPQYDSVLPVCDHWGKLVKYPCRFGGSVYDRTMKIGGTSQKGQYDFYREISVGDGVFFTDMEGNRFSYTVTDIRYDNKADPSAFKHKDSSLTLFIQNIYAFEYIIIYCDTMNG